ncbi:SRPBCC family protein [Emticicia soli]|uniref:SRPBCC domain-containing protein n=1 Tax=Emticicia soli TaxID=2027878 RepID=A0ABW5J3F8_9BACT
MNDSFYTNVIINAAQDKVWQNLTRPSIMLEWMGDPDMDLQIDTNWKINSPIIISGFHHTKFENKGIVLTFDIEQKLSFTHLSSVSQLPDIPESYSKLTFILEPVGEHTLLSLNIENFPTESIRKHLEFYWRATLVNIKNKTETSEK